MKTETYFLMLPFVATVINLLMAFLLLPHSSHSQPILQDAAPLLDHNSNKVMVDDSSSSLYNYVVDLDGNELKPQEQQQQHSLLQENDEKDPMLQPLPFNPDFEAYVRADISSFYGLSPGSVQEQKPIFNGQAGKFVNISPETVSLYWDGPQQPVFNSDVGPWGSGGTACFPTHQFIFTKQGQPSQVLCRFTIVPGTSVYYCDPFKEDKNDTDDDDEPARGVRGDAFVKRSLAELSATDRAFYDKHVYNWEFGEQYKNFTGGSEWLAMYPAQRPQHKMWRADHFGQEHTVVTPETQFQTMPPPEEFTHGTLSVEQMRQDQDENGRVPLADYRAPGGALNLTVKSLSCAPRAFEIQHFLSDVEVDHIIDLVNKKSLIRSTTGQDSKGQVSETRTSSTTWLPRQSDPILNVIFRRAADVLRMDEALLRHRSSDEQLDGPSPENLQKINEDLQIVHYDKGQQYTAHHDFSYPKDAGPKHKVRSINLCMYLNDVPAGGQTSFPRWRNADSGKSIDVVPQKGKAMIFYMVNPDGNLDDLTQHAALPVIEGEKFFANLWISSF